MSSRVRALAARLSTIPLTYLDESCREQLASINARFVYCDPTKPKSKEEKEIEKRHRQTVENIRRTLETVQRYETRLGIRERWVRGSDEWSRHESMFRNRQYQRCLDDLERLVVSRMFELTKMNMSGTGKQRQDSNPRSKSALKFTDILRYIGYKMRKHIAKALQARSHAIRACLERYNSAASKLSPPRPKLTWNQVVEYAFLADFDLLRDARQDIRKKPWAQPANRVLMDRYFKCERAREEIQRLNIEIRRVITHINDEENYLLEKEETVYRSDPVLAYHIGNYRLQRTRFSSLHLKQLSKLSGMEGFTGTLTPGVSVDGRLQTSGGDVDAMEVDLRKAPDPSEHWEDVEDGDELDPRHKDMLDLDEEEDMETAFNLLQAAGDK